MMKAYFRVKRRKAVRSSSTSSISAQESDETIRGLEDDDTILSDSTPSMAIRKSKAGDVSQHSLGRKIPQMLIDDTDTNRIQQNAIGSDVSTAVQRAALPIFLDVG